MKLTIRWRRKGYCRSCGKKIDYSEMKDGYTGDECADCNLKRVLLLVLTENHITQLDITSDEIKVSLN